jgi:hypothetical protein
MENKSEYSDRINYHDWPEVTDSGTPVNWKLDRDDEKQIEANIEALEINKQYLEDKLNDTQKDSNPNKKQTRIPGSNPGG